MKGKGKAKRKGKKDTGKLQKYMVTVNDFVKSKVGCDETEDGSGLRFVKKKSRKEMRKEKRKMKKAKIKNHYEGYKALKASTCDSEEVATPSDKQPTKKVNGKVKKDEPASQQPKSTPVETAAGEKAEKKGPKKPSKKEKKRNKLEESRKKALLEANVAEDREIKRLERSLGYNKRKNKKKLPQSFADDGLDYILGVLDAGSAASRIVHDSDDDMDIAKEKLRKLVDSESEMSGEEEEEQGDDSEEEGSELDRDGDLDATEEEEDGMDEDDENEMDESGGIASEEENGKDEGVESGDSTLAGPKADTAVPSAGKYVPPHLRDTGDDKRRAELERLKRQVKGLVNRLSEANMASISGQLEELYMSSSRKDMNDTLTEILLAACVTPALMPDRLLMEHVLLVSILHHTTVVRQFNELYKSPGEGKECDNLVAMVAHLYNFQVVHALLIFDILKMLVGAFAEKDIELVLFVLKNVGFALRKDDALALKELISEAQSKASGVGTKFQDENRVRFMLETMLALKNNDMRKIPGYDPEPVERLRKLQRTLFSSKVLDLARKQRMNTDIRRNIFCVIMTSEDYLDAFEKLIRLGLKDQQEREIVHVLMDCCLQEKSFNAFYSMTFQFSLWDKFKDLSSLSTSTFSNLVQLVTRFLQRKCLSLSILKVIEFGELDKPKVKFLRQVLTKLLKDTEPEDLANIFGRISGIPKLGMLREGLKLFISHFLLKNAQSQGPAEQAGLLSERAEVANKAMEAKETKLKL
ncbi:unnamed protein product [Coregonus sp. 'balchen']|nr:unnamed protein product [Coregonus sp. 'balchen']